MSNTLLVWFLLLWNTSGDVSAIQVASEKDCKNALYVIEHSISGRIKAACVQAPSQ